MSTFNTSTWTGTDTSTGLKNQFSGYVAYTWTPRRTQDYAMLEITSVGVEKHLSGSNDWTAGNAYGELTITNFGSESMSRNLGSSPIAFGTAAETKKRLWKREDEFNFTRRTSEYTITISLSLQKTGSYSGYRTGQITLTVPALDSYEITYNANLGSGGPGTKYKYYNQSYTIITSSSQGTLPTRTGYTFAGWATSSTGSVVYRANTTYSYTTNAALTLYAVWTPDTYQISYNNNGGQGTITSQTKTYNQALTLSNGSGFTKQNCKLMRWNTNSGGTGTSYSLSGTYPASTNGNATLYAVWAPYITITFDKNYPNAPAPTTKDMVSTEAIGTLPVVTRPNANFLGWYTASTGGTKVTPATTFTIDTTLYAQWELIYVPPYFNEDIKTYRCDSNGDEADEGAYGKVTYSITPGTLGGETLTYSLVGGYKQSGTSDPWTTITLNTSNTEAIFGGSLSTDLQYDVYVQLLDHNNVEIKTLQNYISTASFIIDVRADGEAIGFGKSSVQGEDGIHSRFPITIGDYGENPDNNNKYKLIVANGESSSSRHNAFSVDSLGNVINQGNLAVGSNTTISGSITIGDYSAGGNYKLLIANGTSGNPSNAFGIDSDGHLYINSEEFFINPSNNYSSRFFVKGEGTDNYVELGTSVSNQTYSGYLNFITSVGLGYNFSVTDNGHLVLNWVPTIHPTMSPSGKFELDWSNFDYSRDNIFNVDMTKVLSSGTIKGIEWSIDTKTYTNQTSAAWEYIQYSITVPSSHIYLVSFSAGWNTGRPEGIGFHSESTLNSNNVNPNFAVALSGVITAPIFMLNPGTWYAFVKRNGANNSNTSTFRVFDITLG